MELTFHIAESPLPKDVLRGDTVAIYTEYNEDVVEVFRSTPNSVWSNIYKCWDVRKCMVSVFTRKIKELCNRKNYTSKFYIADSLKNTSVHKNIDIDKFEFVTTPYEFQKEGVEFMYKHPKCFLGDEPGAGKSLSNDSFLYYEDGIHTIGDAKVGDRIYGRDGKLHTIIGVYPQGELETYRVTMYDHSYVDCSLDHIWRIKTGYNGKYKDITLKELLCQKGTFTTDFQEFYFHDSVLNPKHCIPKCKPVEFNNPNSGIAYDTIENRIEYLLKLFSYINEDFSNTVMISDDYKYLIHKSFAFTFDLKKNHEGITRINSNEIKTLVNSLGGSYFTDVIKGITQDKHFIDVIVFSKEITECVKHLCRTRNFGFSPIDYKILNITPAQETSLRNMVRNVFSKQYDSVGIESIAKLDKVPCTCIKIDAEDSLFLTNDYIVTHNTKQIIDYARYLRKNEGLKHALIICGVNGNKYNWKVP